MDTRTAYKCRAYLDPDRTALFARTFGSVRLVWNKTLAERRRAYETDGNRTTCEQTAEPAFPNEVSSIPLQQTLRHQHTALAGLFARRAYYPCNKTRTGR